MPDNILEHIRKSSLFSAMDYHFASFIDEMISNDKEILTLTASLVSRELRFGHVCLMLEEYAGKSLSDDDGNLFIQNLPEMDFWQSVLQKSEVCGEPGEYKPLILFDGLIYLQKYWYFQSLVAENILSAVEFGKDKETIPEHPWLSVLFPNKLSIEAEDHKRAVQTALSKRFCVITGGPGTGKTTTVARILYFLLAQEPTLSIMLAAPTGKAAARMNEAVQSAAGEIKKILLEAGYETTVIWNKISGLKGSTIHRLLGTVLRSLSFRHDHKNPLPADVVIVDEASMVDIALMARLMDALKRDSRLILLGDKNQLASVEAGSVLADICDSVEDKNSPLNGNIIFLRKSFRFKDKPGIMKLADLINRKKSWEEISDLFSKYNSEAGIDWKKSGSLVPLPEDIRQIVIENYKKYIREKDPLQALIRLNSFRVLCCVNYGVAGTINLNKLIEDILAEENLIQPATEFYENRPVLVTANDYTVGLFNGDVGIVRNGKVCFPGQEEGKLKTVIPALIPSHETVFAMTIHKSQGSEFDQILMILPEKDISLLTRELLYTGITRAKKLITVLANEDIFKQAVSREIRRASGLKNILKSGPVKKTDKTRVD